MGVRTFYWDPAVTRKPSLFRRRTGLRVGNAGDLYNRDLIAHLYGQPSLNKEDGPRLLLVGSVIHRARSGDIVCGVGTKGADLPDPRSTQLALRAVRGPLTVAALAERGFDTSSITSLADPGLYVASVYPELVAQTAAEHGRVIFIPHYRDLRHFRSGRDYRLVSIDCEPRDLVREILRAEFIYTSSLHGLIFAHALGRPALLVAPVEGEPELKYQDYFASVGLPWVAPVGIEDAVRGRKVDAPIHFLHSQQDFAFPSVEELAAAGVLDGSASPSQH